jgi:hypothetical protein
LWCWAQKDISVPDVVIVRLDDRVCSLLIGIF